MAVGALPNRRAELLYLLMGLVESVWLTPYALIFIPGAWERPVTWTALAVTLNLCGAVLILRWLNRAQVPNAAIQFAVIIGIALASLLTISIIPPGTASPFAAFLPIKSALPAWSFTVVAVAILWFRGSHLATITVTPARAGFALRLGIVGLMFAALIPEERIRRAVLLLIPIFFFFGLVTTALARSASLRLNRDLERSAFGARWLRLTVIVAGALSAFGYVVALVLGGLRFEGLLGGLGNAFIALVAVIVTLLSPLLTALQSLISRLMGRVDVPAIVTAAGDPLKQAQEAAATRNPLLENLINASPLLCITLIMLVLLLVIFARVRTRRVITARDGEERETLASTDPLIGLRAALANGLQNLQDALTGLLPGGRDALAALTVRRLYARLLALAEQSGTPRPVAQTPFEFESALQNTFPAHRSLITDLTHAYSRAHYGELPDDPGFIPRARTALNEIAREVSERRRAAIKQNS